MARRRCVDGRVEENRMERREGDKAPEPSLLAGIVFDATSEPMTPTHAVKKGTRYRYYVSRQLITALAASGFSGQRVPAACHLETKGPETPRKTHFDISPLPALRDGEASPGNVAGN
jgi:hypothetical protein